MPSLSNLWDFIASGDLYESFFGPSQVPTVKE